MKNSPASLLFTIDAMLLWFSTVRAQVASAVVILTARDQSPYGHLRENANHKGWRQPMSFYENQVLPHLIHMACGLDVFDRQRAALVPVARGRVLEVGMGSGHNLPHYDPSQVELVWGLEPSAGMRRKARQHVADVPFEVRWLDLPGEEIPLDDNSADTVVITYTLCTIPDWHLALEQMRRVLKPGGQLLFCEHGTAPDKGVRQWQDRITPLWRRAAGGCHLNRNIPELLRQSGFSVQRMQSGYLPSMPRVAGFNFRGAAIPR